jgi:hypothetical protein
MRRGKSVLSNGAGYFNPELPPIVLGTMALRGVYAVFDMDTGRVGLASKQGLAVNSKNCAAAVQVTLTSTVLFLHVYFAYTACAACAACAACVSCACCHNGNGLRQTMRK